MKMIAYARVSTLRQAADGYGLDAQRDIIEAEAARRGWQLTWFVDEGRSAKTIDKRPQLLAALDALKRKEYDGIVCSKLDRLSRSMKDFGDLCERSERQGWSIVAIDLGVDTTTPAGELMANVVASVARYERRMIGLRTKEGLAAARDRGVRLGAQRRIPAEVVTRIQDERAAGASLRAIADGLNNECIPPSGGGARWHASTIKNVLSYRPEVAAHS